MDRENVELDSLAFLLDPFQSLTLLKNPLLGFMYTNKSTSLSLSLTHRDAYIHTHAYIVYVSVYIYISAYVYVCGL